MRVYETLAEADASVAWTVIIGASACRQRDTHALTQQHFLIKRDTLTTAGAILAGQKVTVMVF